MFYSRIAALALIVSTGAWLITGLFSENDLVNEDNEDSQASTFKVEVEVLQPFQHSRRLTLSATTEAHKSVDILSRAGGAVEFIDFRKGDFVSEGETLVTLSDDGRRASYESALARLAQKEAEFSARVQLIENGTIPALEKERLEFEIADAKAALEKAYLDLKNTSILAPISGIVETTDIESGQIVAPGQAIARIVSLNQLLAVAEIPERLRSEISVGDNASVSVLGGEKIDGQVSFVAADANPVTRTYRVEVSFPNHAYIFAGGATSEITFELDPSVVAAIPRSALTFSSQGQLGVRTVDEYERVDFNAVTIVEDQGSRLFVSGLASGTRVIVTGQEFVTTGQQVDAVEKE